MDFSTHKPIYIQIVEQIEDKVVMNKWEVNQKIPSVRETAASFGVNPNTVMRSYELLERNGIIYNRRGLGFFVSESSKDKINAARKRIFMEEELPALFSKMNLLGVDIDDVVDLYRTFCFEQ